LMKDVAGMDALEFFDDLIPSSRGASISPQSQQVTVLMS